MRAIGQRYSGLETFTSFLKLPKTVAANNFGINKLVKTIKAVADITM